MRTDGMWMRVFAFSIFLTPVAAADAGRTLDEWLRVYEPMFLARSAEWRKVVSDPGKFEAFYEGANEVDRLQHRLMLRILSYRTPWFKACDEPWTGVEKREALIQEYRQWFQNKGWDMMRRWRKGELTPAETQFIPVLKIGYLYRGYVELKSGFGRGKALPQLSADESACVAYVDGMMDRFEATQRKALERRPLTEDDLDVFRAVAALDRMRNGAFGSPFPDLGLRREQPLAPGTRNAEWFFPKLDATFASPAYTDNYPRHPFDLFFPESVVWALKGLADFALDEAGRLAPKPEAVAEMKRSPDFFRLSNFRGRKIVLLINSSMLNDHDDHGRHMHWRIIEQLYGEQVEVIYVHTPHGRGEQWFPSQSPFGPPMDYSRIGAAGKEFLGSCPPTREELARDVKLSLMLYPHLSHTYSYGLPNAVTWYGLDGGNMSDYNLVLIDIDGTVVFNQRPPFPYVHRTTGILRNRFCVPLVEQEIRRMIANGGRGVTGAQARLTIKDLKSWKCPEGARQITSPMAGEKTTYRFEGYDPAMRLISVSEQGRDGFGTPRQLRVNLDKSVEYYTVFHINNREIEVTQLKPGDLVHLATYQYPGQPQIYASLVGMNHCYSRGGNPKAPLAAGYYDSYWVAGTVQGVDAVRRLVKITRRAPEPEKMHGLRYIRQAGANARLFGVGLRNYQLLQASLKEYADTPETVVRVVPGAVIFRNGEHLGASLAADGACDVVPVTIVELRGSV